jgi:serine/threonine protein kinase
VYKAIDLDDPTRKPVAMKKVRRDARRGYSVTVMREISLLMRLKHPNIVALYEVCTYGTDGLFLVMNAMDADLLSLYYSKVNGRRCVAEPYAKWFFRQVVRAPPLCASRFTDRDRRCVVVECTGILSRTQRCAPRRQVEQRELGAVNTSTKCRPTQIFVTVQGELRLGDFGLARELLHDQNQRAARVRERDRQRRRAAAVTAVRVANEALGTGGSGGKTRARSRNAPAGAGDGGEAKRRGSGGDDAESYAQFDTFDGDESKRQTREGSAVAGAAAAAASVSAGGARASKAAAGDKARVHPDDALDDEFDDGDFADQDQSDEERVDDDDDDDDDGDDDDDDDDDDALVAGGGLSFDDRCECACVSLLCDCVCSELEAEDTDALFDDDPMYTNRVVTLWYRAPELVRADLCVLLLSMRHSRTYHAAVGLDVLRCRDRRVGGRVRARRVADCHAALPRVRCDCDCRSLA